MNSPRQPLFHRVARGLSLGAGTLLLLLAGRDLGASALGFLLTLAAFFWTGPSARRIRSLAKTLIPVTLFVCLYGLAVYGLSRTDPAGGPTGVDLLNRTGHLFLRSVGMLFSLFALEAVLAPLAKRIHAGNRPTTRATLMVGLSYQLVPILLQSLEGITLAQKASYSRHWWLKPSGWARAASSLVLLSSRLAEETALALTVRFRGARPSPVVPHPALRPHQGPAKDPKHAGKGSR